MQTNIMLDEILHEYLIYVQKSTANPVCCDSNVGVSNEQEHFQTT